MMYACMTLWHSRRAEYDGLDEQRWSFSPLTYHIPYPEIMMTPPTLFDAGRWSAASIAVIAP